MTQPSVQAGRRLAAVVPHLLASAEFAPARGHALDLQAFEQVRRIDLEGWLNATPRRPRVWAT